MYFVNDKVKVVSPKLGYAFLSNIEKGKKMLFKMYDRAD